jgi:hypothetical protein
LLGRILMQDPEHGAQSTLYAATHDLQGGSFVGPGGLGHLRGDPQLITASRGARDSMLGRRLWDISARLTGTDLPLSR